MAEQHTCANLIIGNMNLIDIDDAIINNLIYVKPTHHSVLAEGIVLANQAASRKRSLNQKIGFLNEEIHFGFDYEWFLRILKTSNPYILIKYGVIFGGGVKRQRLQNSMQVLTRNFY